MLLFLAPELGIFDDGFVELSFVRIALFAVQALEVAMGGVVHWLHR